jgi:4-amino-4-deoxy-L-arabinose transferase-like glycosyltransferase
MVLRHLDDLADSFISKVSKHSWLLYSLVFVLSLALFLPGIFDMPPMDRDETRFAQATKQMLETQNFTDIRLGDQPRYQKPVGIYWLQAAVVSVAAYVTDTIKPYTEIGYYRIPSVIGAIIAILATIAMARRLFGRESAVFAGLMAPIPLLVTIEAHLAKADSVLVACTALSLYVLACLWRLTNLGQPFKFKTRHFLIFWLALSVGILVKGMNLAVIVPVIIALSIANKGIKWLAPLKAHYGICLVLVCVLPWFIMIQDISGGQFFTQSAGGDLLNKVLSGVQSHGAPPLTHLLAHFGVFWPLSLLSPFALIVMFKARKINDAYVFVLASIIPVWLIFELVPTKLPHYTYPLYSLLIVGISGVCVQLIHDHYDILKGKLYFLWAFIYLVISCLVATAIPTILYYYAQQIDVLTLTLSVLSVLTALLVLIKLRHGFIHGVVILLTIQALIIMPNVFGRVIPKIHSLDLANSMNNAIDISGCSRNAVFVSGYNEPSVMFKIGTQTHFATTQTLIEQFKMATPCSLFFIGNDNLKFRLEFPQIQPIATFNGIAINGGDIVHIDLYKR